MVHDGDTNGLRQFMMVNNGLFWLVATGNGESWLVLVNHAEHHGQATDLGPSAVGVCVCVCVSLCLTVGCYTIRYVSTSGDHHQHSSKWHEFIH